VENNISDDEKEMYLMLHGIQSTVADPQSISSIFIKGARYWEITPFVWRELNDAYEWLRNEIN
jgi:hypothetical protein